MDQLFVFAIPVFLAGIATFLAPCTLPLVPAYLGIISGVPQDVLRDPARFSSWRWKIFLNGLLYVVGFSVVFILLGASFGLFGAHLAQWRALLERIAGIFVILFGFFLLAGWKLPNIPGVSAFQQKLAARTDRSRPLTAFLLGMAFGVGWTPCVGPILGVVLTLASVSADIGTGVLLLAIFSLGLALPFLGLALVAGTAMKAMPRIISLVQPLSALSGVLFIGLGILLFSGNMQLLIQWGFSLARFLNINYEFIYNYL